MQIQFNQPAARWIEALPVGNGPLGAMIFGGFATQHIQVNEHTMWEGKLADRVSPTGLQALPEVRRLLFARQYAEAQKLVEQEMLYNCKLKPYQPLCSLLATSTHHGEAFDFVRRLDLLTGVHYDGYKIWRWGFHRECFASLADGVLVARFWADGEKGLTHIIRLDREQDVQSIRAQGNCITLTGRLGDEGVKFQAQAMILHEDGQLRVRGNAIEVRDASAITVILAGATSYVAPDDLSADPARRCQEMLARVAGKTYQQLRDAHVAAHSSQMGRVQFKIEGGEDRSAMPTGQRLLAFSGRETRPLHDEHLHEIGKTPEDWDFYHLIFQTCRYMLLDSSQGGSMPSTLQGRWCGVMNPPWDCDYHPNINLQMNYWLANPTNLDECNRPLFDWLKQVAKFGTDTARRLYGCDGWVMHHVSDIFASTGPMDGPFGVWPVGGAWVCQHLWEHYQFTQDKKFLSQTALPIMLESARFMLGFLVEAPAGTPFAGKLVTAPSHSPENTFFTDKGEQAWISVSAAMDTQIIEQLFRSCLTGLEATGETSPLAEKIADALRRLPPMQVSPKTGRLMEWIEDFDEPEPGHRHISHMFAIYPGDGISRSRHPELLAAARKSIDWRLSHDYHATGWSLPWLGCILARMGDGNKALEMLTQRIAHFTMPNAMFSNAHGQPQVGDACGFAAAVAEMLLQSHEGFIHILPALPDKWHTGSLQGLRARGGFEVDIAWNSGKATEVKIRSLAGERCKVMISGKMHDLRTTPGEVYRLS